MKTDASGVVHKAEFKLQRCGSFLGTTERDKGGSKREEKRTIETGEAGRRSGEEGIGGGLRVGVNVFL